jgi:uncharacterized protein (DUF697 family)
MSEKEKHHDEALRIVKVNSGWSAAAGFIPVPVVDLAATAALQLWMVKQLADHYEVPFRKDLAKSLIAAALGSGTAVAVSAPLASFAKAVPVLGTFVSTFVAPAAGAAATFSLGKVFIQHFEAGGTLLDFDPETLRKHFYEEYRKQEAAARNVEPAAA